MCSRGVLVHCPSRLGATVAVQAAEIPCGEGAFTKSACEHAKAVHHFDGVMSHTSILGAHLCYDSELKLPRITPPDGNRRGGGGRRDSAGKGFCAQFCVLSEVRRFDNSVPEG
jgi:hypothetical protein